MIATLLRFRMSPRLTSAVLVVAALVMIVAVGCGSSGAASDVAIFPMAGTPTASPKTQISLRGQGADQLTGVTAKGSQSGTHTLTKKPHPDGNGASFFSSKSYTRGETVTVKADPKLVGEKSGAVKFRIAEKAKVGVPGHVQPDPGGTSSGAQDFHSLPKLHPPTVKITKKTSSVAPGELFLAPKAGPGQDGTIIADGSGKLIWFKQVPKLTSPFDFRVQTYEGKPVLTWWQGGVHHGQGQGSGRIVNTSYKQIAKVSAGNGYKADFHEFQLSRNGKTAFLLIYEPVGYDTRKVGGEKNGSVIDGIVQEVDVKTGLVLFEWHALGNIKIDETYNRVPKAVPLLDHTHVNSVYEEENSNLLVSSRDTHSALELDRQTGRIKWRLGGKASDYSMGKDTQFIGQHDIRRAPDGRITVFDNGTPPSPGRPARAIALKVNDGTKSVKLSRSFRRPEKPHSPSQGNMQALPNGNFMVSWGGDQPFFNEYTPSGKVALDGYIDPKTDDTYRVWRFDWHAQPTQPPDVAAENKSGKTVVYASWNGATEVAQWQVLTGPTSPAAVPGTKAAKKGFETKITLPNVQTNVAVQALDSNGAPLGPPSKTVQPTG
jgi:Arylsulfotransferase (ASST)